MATDYFNNPQSKMAFPHCAKVLAHIFIQFHTQFKTDPFVSLLPLGGGRRHDVDAGVDGALEEAEGGQEEPLEVALEVALEGEEEEEEEAPPAVVILLQVEVAVQVRQHDLMMING